MPNVDKQQLYALARMVSGISKMGRNEPCWCGSGKKFKKCHMDREHEEPIDQYKFWTEALLHYENKSYCSHPSAPDKCGKIINAHTLTKSQSIKSISEKGHVYTGKPNMKFVKNEEILPRKIGINLASTFKGFCAPHDNSTFKPIEKGEVMIDSESIFLLSYRIAAYEVYQKEAELYALRKIKDIGDKGLSIFEQVKFQIEWKSIVDRVDKNFISTDKVKHAYDKILLSENRKSFKWAAVEFDTLFPIVSAVGFFPEYDFECDHQRKPLFDRNIAYEIFPSIIVNIINNKENAILSLGWLSNDKKCELFVEQFIKKIQIHGMDFAVFFAIASSENTYYRPSWWESLSGEVQAHLRQVAQSETNGTRWQEVILEPIALGLTGNIVNIQRNYQ